MIEKVYLLQHVYEEEGAEEVKLIGVYRSNDEARLAIERMKLLPGFVDHPDDFCVSEFELGKDHWQEGFATITTVNVPGKDGSWMKVEAVTLADGNFQLVNLYEAENMKGFHHDDIVICEDREDGYYVVGHATNRNSKF